MKNEIQPDIPAKNIDSILKIENENWLWKNKHAIKMVKRGLKQAKARKLKLNPDIQT